MSNIQFILTIAVCAAATMLTRFLPFLVFGSRGGKVPEVVEYLGHVLPAAIFGMLIVYCLKGVSLTSGSHGIPEAIAIGVTIARSGAFPQEGTESAQLVEAAAHECLTNLVRHAGGTRLEIISEKTASGWRVRYLNDGAVPSGPIVEGSGLTALRARTEAASGAMEIVHAPRFELTLTLPEERQEIP